MKLNVCLLIWNLSFKCSSSRSWSTLFCWTLPTSLFLLGWHRPTYLELDREVDNALWNKTWAYSSFLQLTESKFHSGLIIIFFYLFFSFLFSFFIFLHYFTKEKSIHISFSLFVSRRVTFLSEQIIKLIQCRGHTVLFCTRGIWIVWN